MTTPKKLPPPKRVAGRLPPPKPRTLWEVRGQVKAPADGRTLYFYGAQGTDVTVCGYDREEVERAARKAPGFVQVAYVHLAAMGFIHEYVDGQVVAANPAPLDTWRPGRGV